MRKCEDKQSAQYWVSYYFKRWNSSSFL